MSLNTGYSALNPSHSALKNALPKPIRSTAAFKTKKEATEAYNYYITDQTYDIACNHLEYRMTNIVKIKFYTDTHV